MIPRRLLRTRNRGHNGRVNYILSLGSQAGLNSLTKILKEGCLMMYAGMMQFVMEFLRQLGIEIRIGVIGLNVGGGSGSECS